MYSIFLAKISIWKILHFWSFWMEAILNMDMLVFFIVCLYLYYHWRSRYVGIQLTTSTLPHFCAIPKPGHCHVLCSMVWNQRWLFVLLIMVELLNIKVQFFFYNAVNYNLFYSIKWIARNAFGRLFHHSKSKPNTE
jgi:hypothetical protein